MHFEISLTPSRSNYTVVTSIGGVNYQFANVRWNDEDKAWYLDFLEEDGTPILVGIKLVLGVALTRRSTHAFFKKRSLSIVDTSGNRADAGLDDLGGRIRLILTDASDVTA